MHTCNILEKLCIISCWDATSRSVTHTHTHTHARTHTHIRAALCVVSVVCNNAYKIIIVIRIMVMIITDALMLLIKGSFTTRMCAYYTTGIKATFTGIRPLPLGYRPLLRQHTYALFLPIKGVPELSVQLCVAERRVWCSCCSCCCRRESQEERVRDSVCVVCGRV